MPDAEVKREIISNQDKARFPERFDPGLITLEAQKRTALAPTDIESDPGSDEEQPCTTFISDSSNIDANSKLLRLSEASNSPGHGAHKNTIATSVQSHIHCRIDAFEKDDILRENARDRQRYSLIARNQQAQCQIVSAERLISDIDRVQERSRA